MALIAAAPPQPSLEESNPKLVEQFYIASAKGDLAQVKAMVQATPALVNVKHWPDGGGWLPIHEAAKNNHKPVVEYFLSVGVSADAVSDGVTPLHITAMESRDPDAMIEFLLSPATPTSTANRLPGRPR